MLKKLLFPSLLFCIIAAGFLYGDSRHFVAIKTKLTITGSGRDQHNGVILVEDGKITGVGSGLKIPWNAEVIDESDKIVMPGFVLAHTSQGLERANEYMPDVPFLSTFDAIDPFQRFFRESLRNGITSILVLPGNNTRFGGTGTIVKPVGTIVDEMLIRKPVGLKISMSPSSGESRMSHMQHLRSYLRRNKEFLADWEKKKKKAQASHTPFNKELLPAQKTMKALFQGKLKAFVYCPLASDVIRAIELIQQFKFQAVLVLGKSTWKAIPYIKKARLSVILPADIVFFEKDPATGELKHIVLPTLFAEARIPFAFQIDSTSYEARYIWQVAAEAVKYGLSRGTAISAVTSSPANMIGIGSTIGQIKPGMQADLLVLTGDPLDPKTWIDKVMINGEIVYDRNKDKFLQQLLKGNKR